MCPIDLRPHEDPLTIVNNNYDVIINEILDLAEQNEEFKALLKANDGDGMYNWLINHDKTHGRDLFTELYHAVKLQGGQSDEQVIKDFNFKNLPPHLLYNRADLTELHIPAPVEIIGKETLAGCEQLRKVTMDDSVKRIDSSAFYRDRSLEEVQLSKSLETIYPNAFTGCNNLKEITIPASVKALGATCFPENLEKVIFEGNPMFIEYVIINGFSGPVQPFSDCKKLKTFVIREVEYDVSNFVDPSASEPVANLEVYDKDWWRELFANQTAK